MRQHRAAGARGLGQLERHGEMRMGWMRLAAQAIDHEDVDAVEQLHHAPRDFAEVCCITD